MPNSIVDICQNSYKPKLAWITSPSESQGKCLQHECWQGSCPELRWGQGCPKISLALADLDITRDAL